MHEREIAGGIDRVTSLLGMDRDEAGSDEIEYIACWKVQSVSFPPVFLCVG